MAAIAEQNVRKQEPIGGCVEPLPVEKGFEAARKATGQVYELLEGLKKLKQSGGEVDTQGRQLQRQLLALRQLYHEVQ